MTLIDIVCEAVKFLVMVTFLAPLWVATKTQEGMTEPQFQGYPAAIWWLFAAVMLFLAPCLATVAYVFKLATLGCAYLGAESIWASGFDGSFLLIVVPCCFYGVVKAAMRAERLGRRVDAWSGVQGFRGLDTAIAFVCGVGTVSAGVQLARMAFRDKTK